MRSSRFVARSLAVSCVAVMIGLSCALAQANETEYEPKVGQQGKDVVWVPTPQALVETMLDVAKVTPDDVVIDLGSGDGRTVIAAAKRGAKALGIEYNPRLVEVSIRNAAREGVADKVKFVTADLFESDFSEATVITMFLLPELNIRLRPKILDLKPGIRVVSNTFDMGDWSPDATGQIKNGCTVYCVALLWIVPAKVEGTWQMAQGELALEQKYQVVSGTLKAGNSVMPLANGRLNGDRITFSVGGTEYTGRVSGNVMEGTSRSGEKNEQPWRAIRVGQ